MARHAGDRRAGYSAICGLTPCAPTVRFRHVCESDARGWWAMPPGADMSCTLFYVHGGGYHFGSAASYRGLLSQLAIRTGFAVFGVDYPLAPEEPFPAAHDAVLRARDWLLTKGVLAYAVMGDSAGGGLALTLLSAEISVPGPSAAVVFSPWVDLKFAGASFHDPAVRDPIFAPDYLRGLAGTYLDGADPADRRASPLYGMRKGLPPVLLQVGTDELLLDDSRRYAQAAADHGAEVTLHVFEGMHHVFQRDAGVLATADKAVDLASDFVRRHMPPS